MLAPTHPSPSSLCPLVYSILTPGKAFSQILDYQDYAFQASQMRRKKIRLCAARLLFDPPDALSALLATAVPGSRTTTETPIGSLALRLLVGFGR